MKMFAALPIIFLSVPAFAADDQVLTLFPQQRASHQETMDSQAAGYEARGQTYVDAMYSSLGEGEDPYADEGAWENEEPLTAEQLENPFPDVAPVSAETAGEMKTDAEGADIAATAEAAAKDVENSAPVAEEKKPQEETKE
jgi:hypothetical protein